jgi:hypothetical protein
MMRKTPPESLAEKSVTNPGKTTVNGPYSMTDEWSFFYHGVPLADENES